MVTAQSTTGDVLSRVDLVYATTDLDKGIAEIEKLLGVHASIGGQHPGWGTRNALISLGDDVYQEIIGPDPRNRRPGGRAGLTSTT